VSRTRKGLIGFGGGLGSSSWAPSSERLEQVRDLIRALEAEQAWLESVLEGGGAAERFEPAGMYGKPTLDDLNTLKQVELYAKVSGRTIKRAIDAGALEAVHAGAQVRITKEAVWAWLEGRRRD
jgi:excisionase family DNA binding protein